MRTPLNATVDPIARPGVSEISLISSEHAVPVMRFSCCTIKGQKFQTRRAELNVRFYKPIEAHANPSQTVAQGSVAHAMIGTNFRPVEEVDSHRPDGSILWRSYILGEAGDGRC